MNDSRPPYEIVLRLGVDSESYSEAREVGRKLAERFDDADIIAIAGGRAASRKLKLVDFRVERKGALRP
jgi:hypothetical protein